MQYKHELLLSTRHKSASTRKIAKKKKTKENPWAIWVFAFCEKLKKFIENFKNGKLRSVYNFICWFEIGVANKKTSGKLNNSDRDKCTSVDNNDQKKTFSLYSEMNTQTLENIKACAFGNLHALAHITHTCFYLCYVNFCSYLSVSSLVICNERNKLMNN